jgi:hypothetical protein
VWQNAVGVTGVRIIMSVIQSAIEQWQRRDRTWYEITSRLEIEEPELLFGEGKILKGAGHKGDLSNIQVLSGTV